MLGQGFAQRSGDEIFLIFAKTVKILLASARL
jgi:hypothetical protein